MEIGTVHPAFELAPECSSIDEVRHKLKQEGYGEVDDHFQGSLKKDLQRLLRRP
jgi:hypothetical protein